MSDKSSVVDEVIEQGKKFVKAGVSQVVGSADKTSPDQTTKEFVKSLYEPSKEAAPEDQKQKELEDKKKIEKLRQELHAQTYFKDLVNPPKPKEERPAEKTEREEKQKLAELEKKEAKKPPPLPPSAKRGTVEKYPGVSG